MGTNEWYTPTDVLVDARRVLGTLDLDPASCEIANGLVQATTYYTQEQDGLMYSWHGHVWCNPPYGKTPGGTSLLRAFTDKFVQEYCSGHLSADILLIPTNTATRWFDQLWQFPICWPKFRIRFIQPDGKPGSGQSFGTCLVYAGPDEQLFRRVFGGYGHVTPPREQIMILRPEIWGVA